MWRTIIFILEVAVAVAVVIWFIDRPGEVFIEWQGWQIETSFGVMVLVTLITVIFLSNLYVVWKWIKRRPREILKSRRYRLEAKGYRALTDGLAAVAAGDARVAKKLARKVDTLLKEPSLTLLLSAQAAQLDGDELTARQCFEQMLDRSETEFLGLRGLILQALRDSDDARALKYSQRAYSLQPSAAWVLETLVSLHTKQGCWREAQLLVEEAQSHKRLSVEKGRHQQAALLTERARLSIRQNRLSEALEQVRKAYNLDPANSAATVLLASLVSKEGKKRHSKKIIERSWRLEPHPSMCQAYLAIVGDVADLDRYRSVVHLTKENRDHPESRFAIAEAALAAKLWGETKQQLEALEHLSPTVRVFRLWARLAELGAEDDIAARRWIDRATEAEADRAWLCSNCGTVADDWAAVCLNCSEFATQLWKQPPRAHRAIIASDLPASTKAAKENKEISSSPTVAEPEVIARLK
jgi:HemY protein